MFMVALMSDHISRRRSVYIPPSIISRPLAEEDCFSSSKVLPGVCLSWGYDIATGPFQSAVVSIAINEPVDSRTSL